MTKKPHELKFISQIKRDGSGTVPVDESYQKAMKENSLMANENYKMTRLSVSQDTWIASGFNSFVVRLKESTSE